MAVLSSNSSFVGSAGSSRLPLGVQRLSTASPKMASFAIFIARVPALHLPFSFKYLARTFSTEHSLSFSISDYGKALPSGTGLNGKGNGSDKPGLVCLLVSSLDWFVIGESSSCPCLMVRVGIRFGVDR